MSIFKIIMIAIGVVAVGLLLHAIFTNSTGLREPATKPSSISGIIDFAGLKPSAGDVGTVRVLTRLNNDPASTYTDTGVNLPLEDNAVWNWTNAVEGEVYDIKAVLSINGDEITQSPVITVSAPATNQVLVLDVTWDMLPDKVAEEYPVTVSGTVKVNGFIPSGSRIVGYGKRSDSLTDTYVEGPAVTAASTVDWAWDKAANGRKYTFYAIMYDSASNPIGTSDYMEKAAPFSDGNLVINSTAVAPAQKTTISGVVRISGKIPDNSEVDIHARKSDEENYTTIMSLKASGEVTWEWNQADNGAFYEIDAVLDIPDGTDPQSNSVSVTAPAANVLLNIDTGKSLSAPNQKPELSSCEDLDDGKKKAELEYDGISGAKMFWIQIGDEKGKSNIKNSKVTAPASDSSLDFEVKIDEDKDYYTRYAYSTCADCGESSYSTFSDSLKFRCE